MYSTHLDQARTALEALLAETICCNDAEAREEAQLILSSFDDAAADLFALIDEANADDQLTFSEDGMWRLSPHAEPFGLGEAA